MQIRIRLDQETRNSSETKKRLETWPEEELETGQGTGLETGLEKGPGP